MTPDEIEATLITPPDIAEATLLHTHEQDASRGDWPSPRRKTQPSPPWPDADSPVLRFLLWKAQVSIDAGMDISTAMLQLAVHAWFEGGVENYDLGRRHALTG